MSPCDANSTLAQFLEETAARQPIPGGGSVTALVGALAAAIGEMVLNYSIGKKGLESHQESLRTALSEIHRARQLLLELVVEDQAAYQALTAAKKLPRESPQWESDYPPALEAAINAPQLIAITAAAVLDRCNRIVDQVNHYLLSDLAVCAELSMAAVRCGIYNVRVNEPELTDPAQIKRINNAVSHTLSHATQVIQRLIPRIWERNGKGK
jgi:formiminotetrahydrofolate cyclodeaminase